MQTLKVPEELTKVVYGRAGRDPVAGQGGEVDCWFAASGEEAGVQR